MAEKIFMTALSPTMERGTITEWQKKEGDSISSGDVICEVETDKAVMEYESDFDAVLLKILITEGQSAAVGEVIGIYGEAGEDISEFSVSAADTPPQNIISDSDAARTASADKSKAPAEPAAPVAAATVLETEGDRRLKASPLARKMAAAMNVELESVKGSGYDGRVIKRDIEQFAENPVQKTQTMNAESILTPISAMRNTIAQRLSSSKFSAPHFYLTMKADMSSLLKARTDFSKRTDVKPSLNSYLIKLTASALKKYPKVNSSWENGGVRTFGSADIGFAVALEDGLIAPVITKCEFKGISDLDVEFKSLAEKAKNGKLSPAEYSGAGFSISNLGSFGVEEFTAIINPPGAAILAVGAIIKTPVVETAADGTDALVIKPMMKMTLSCDHRAIDGAIGAEFLADLKRMIENPIEALM